MQVTPSIRQKFLEDGYIIVRGIIPDEQLPALRQQYEVLVEQMVHKSEEWESSPQPRLNLSGRPLSGLIDEQTIGCVEAWLPGSEVHRVSSALLGVESASVYEMMMLCSPKREQLHYPAWHRDFEPRSTAPIGSFAADTLEGGPRHLSWNIPLYDDSLFWVLPGSHLRPLAPDEAVLLDENPSQPVPGSVQTFLRAGDGIAKITPILHWACRYSRAGCSPTASPGRKRRGCGTTSCRWMNSCGDPSRRRFPTAVQGRSTSCESWLNGPRAPTGSTRRRLN